jgi:hypothetical protein
MTDEPRHKMFGTPLSEWIERVPNELEMDAVGLWQFFLTYKQDFGISHEAAIEACRQTIIKLIERGGIPVDGVSWERLEQYGTTPEAIALDIVAQWENADIEPFLTDVWFAPPTDVKYANKPLPALPDRLSTPPEDSFGDKHDFREK